MIMDKEGTPAGMIVSENGQQHVRLWLRIISFRCDCG